MRLTESKIRQIIREELLRLSEQNDPKSPSMDDLEFMSDDRIAYEQWANLNGKSSTEVQSVFIDYIADQNLESNEDLQKKLAKELGFDYAAVSAAIKGESKADDSTNQNLKILDLEQVVEAISKI